MQDSLFSNVPQCYEILKQSIHNCVVQKLYSQISFSYLSFANIGEKDKKSYISSLNMIKSANDLFNYLKKFKFITFQISDSNSNEKK